MALPRLPGVADDVSGRCRSAAEQLTGADQRRSEGLPRRRQRIGALAGFGLALAELPNPLGPRDIGSVPMFNGDAIQIRAPFRCRSGRTSFGRLVPVSFTPV